MCWRMREDRRWYSLWRIKTAVRQRHEWTTFSPFLVSLSLAPFLSQFDSLFCILTFNCSSRFFKTFTFCSFPLSNAVRLDHTLSLDRPILGVVFLD